MHAQGLVLPNPTPPVVTSEWLLAGQSLSPVPRANLLFLSLLPGIVEDSGPVEPLCQDFIEHLLDATRCEDGNAGRRHVLLRARGGVIQSCWQVPLTALGFSPHITGLRCWDC